MEEWRDIEGFNGYQVSNEGRIRSLKWGKERIRKVTINKYGYLEVSLCKDEKPTTKRIHRLVAEAFIPNPQNLPEVNHKDEDKTNNNVENLEWCTEEYNHNYGTRLQRNAEKLSKCVDQIDAITGEVIRQWKSTQECGRNGYSNSMVSLCARGLRKTYKGFIWKYPM